MTCPFCRHGLLNGKCTNSVCPRMGSPIAALPEPVSDEQVLRRLRKLEARQTFARQVLRGEHDALLRERGLL